MNQTLFKGPTIQLLPYSSKYWECVAQWFYNKDYEEFFRGYHKALNEEEFKHLPELIRGEVFIAHSLVDNSIVGMIHVIPSGKSNRACYLGLLVDTTSRKKRIPSEMLILVMEYLFNKQGYNKVILEILESNDSLRRSVESAGFYREGKLLQDCFFNGRYQNELRYSMTARHFNKIKDKSIQDYTDFIKEKV